MSKTFFSYNALESQRSSGYRNTAYALAELIDNSLDAEATDVKILFFEKRDDSGKRYIHEILVCDNGLGMNPEMVADCLQFGHTPKIPIEEIVRKKRKGKFGFGLPNASLSQCPNVHVFSWQNPDTIYSTCLNLDSLKPNNSIDIPAVTKVTLPAHYIDSQAQLDRNRGTIVAWRDCDRLSHTRASTIIDKSIELLGRLYRYLLKEGKHISLEIWEHNPQQNVFSKGNTYSVLINDPLYLATGTYIEKAIRKAAADTHETYSPSFQKFVLSTGGCKPTNRTLDDHCFPVQFKWKGATYNFEITTSYAFIDVQKPGIREGAKTPVGRKYGEKDHISFVRADREISSGDYGFYLKTEPQHRWWTIEVKFDADSDVLLGVHNNKQGIEFVKTDANATEEFNEHTATMQQAREACWILLSRKIANAQKAVFKEVKRQGAEWDTSHADPTNGNPNGPLVPTLPESTPTARSASIVTDGTRTSLFTQEQKDALKSRLAVRFQSVPGEEIDKAIARFDERKVRGCVLYCASENDALWSWTSIYNFLVVLINTQHSFYKNIMAPLRNGKFEPALAAIELFISSLAWEENEHFGTEEKSQIIEEFRSYVGLHLNRYLRDNQIEIKESDFKILAEDKGTDEPEP
jgi:hypothetical protein